MDAAERKRVDELVAACARIALWLVDELEPLGKPVVEQDLDDLYELAIAAERRFREAYPESE